MKRSKIVRKRKLVRVDIQLKIVFITLFVTSLVLLINFQLNLAGLWSLSNNFMESQDTRALLDAYRAATIRKFLLSVAMAIPLAASVGILYSFKFCGPIYRFKEYLRSLVNDRWDTRCALRKGDDLQDVCDMINFAVDTLRNRIRRDHAFFQEVKSLLEENESVLRNDETREQIDSLKTEIELEAETYLKRFGPRLDAEPPSADEKASSDADGSMEQEKAEGETPKEESQLERQA